MLQKYLHAIMYLTLELIEAIASNCMNWWFIITAQVKISEVIDTIFFSLIAKEKSISNLFIAANFMIFLERINYCLVWHI